MWRQKVEKIHQHAIKKSGIEPWTYQDIRFLTLALCGECGELANLIKKHWRGDQVQLPEVDPAVREELADIRVYLHLLAKALHIDLDAAVFDKLPRIEQKFLTLEMLKDLYPADPALRESYESTREGRPIRANVETDPTLVELPPE